MSVSRWALIAVAGLLISCGCLAASFAQQSDDATAPAAEKSPAGAARDAAQLVGELVVGPESDFVEVIPGREATFRLALQAVEDNAPMQSLAEVLVGQIETIYTQQLTTAAAAMRPWGPEQATGAPNTPGHPAQGTAWCPATADGQEEWLELTYAEPVEPLVLVVYENLKPGALTRVVAFDAEGNELNAWSGKDPSPPDGGDGSAISVVPLKLKKIKIVRVRLYLDSPHVEGWNEIDAVGILDVKGAMHWATAATASSTWVGDAKGTSAIEHWLTPTLLKGNVYFHDVSGLIALDPARAASGTLLAPDPSDRQVTVAELLAQPDRVAQFEERVKKLEAELAGLREALQKLKSNAPNDGVAKP
jgi:hypothetical protein